VPNPENDNLKQQATQALVESLNDLIVGARSDLQNFAQAIIADSVDAAAAGDQETLAQLRNQTKSLMELNRLRAVHGAERTIFRLVGLALNLVLKFVVPIPLTGVQQI